MLTDAKVGDVLLVGGSNPYLSTVTKTTKTLVCCGSTKFNRQGRLTPRQKWDYTHARIATEIDVAQVKEEIHRRQCINVILAKTGNINDLRAFSTKKLICLVAVLEND